MHAIREMIARNRPTPEGALDIIDYFNSPNFFVRKAAEALHTAHFGPRDLRHSALNRAARFRQKAFEARAGHKVARIKHITW